MTARRPLLGNDRRVEALVIAGAENAAQHTIEETLALVRCPECGRLDRSAVLRAMLPSFGVGLLALVATFYLVRWYIITEPNLFGAVLFGVAVPASALVFWRRQRWRWTRADERVLFLGDEEAQAIVADEAAAEEAQAAEQAELEARETKERQARRARRRRR